jgi:urease accessory protein UreF
MFVLRSRPTEIARAGKGVGASLNADERRRNIFNCLKTTFIARKLPRPEATFCRQRATIGTQLADRMSMWPQPELARDPAEWLGDAHPLVEQLGSADGLASLHALANSLCTQPVASLPALREFLRCYHERVLLPHELPAIQTAFAHATRHEIRELVALDLQLAREPALQDFAEASRRVGQAQLQKLRPLRDERAVQRYLHAVENGEAHGWHTLVYGLTLMLYSLPLRQGLLGYAHQTTGGFIQAAARSLQLTEANCRGLFAELCAPLPGAVASLVSKLPA